MLISSPTVCLLRLSSRAARAVVWPRASMATSCRSRVDISFISSAVMTTSSRGGRNPHEQFMDHGGGHERDAVPAGLALVPEPVAIRIDLEEHRLSGRGDEQVERSVAQAPGRAQGSHELGGGRRAVG